jgi:hypothetical protein
MRLRMVARRHHPDTERNSSMTGPEHYQAAEELLTRAADAAKYEPEYWQYLTAQAQAHATLALAAATASQPAEDILVSSREWEQVLNDD